MTETPMEGYSRRSFLVGAAAMLATACSGTEGEDGAADRDSATTASTATTRPTTEAAPTVTPPSAKGTSADVDGDQSTPPPLLEALFTGLPLCALTPSAAEGPFPNLAQLNRQDITERYPGHPLRLGIRVVDSACEPIQNAQVEIWHADATGDYSSYADNGSGKDEGEGSTFLRGFQTADESGILEFQTIYPGWYEGRAVHIHVTVRLDGQDVLTTQLYFDEAYTEAVYAVGEYVKFGPPDTGWADDSLIGDPSTDGSAIVLAAGPTNLGAGTLGLINLGVPV